MEQTQSGYGESQNSADYAVGLSGLLLPLLTSGSLLESRVCTFQTLQCQGLRRNAGLFPGLSSSSPFLSVAGGLQGCELLPEVCLRSVS